MVCSTAGHPGSWWIQEYRVLHHINIVEHYRTFFLLYSPIWFIGKWFTLCTSSCESINVRISLIWWRFIARRHEHYSSTSMTSDDARNNIGTMFSIRIQELLFTGLQWGKEFYLLAFAFVTPIITLPGLWRTEGKAVFLPNQTNTDRLLESLCFSLTHR